MHTPPPSTRSSSPTPIKIPTSEAYTKNKKPLYKLGIDNIFSENVDQKGYPSVNARAGRKLLIIKEKIIDLNTDLKEITEFKEAYNSARSDNIKNPKSGNIAISLENKKNLAKVIKLIKNKNDGIYKGIYNYLYPVNIRT